MPTRYEFGFGYGEIYQRRLRGQEDMRRRTERWLRELPEQDRQRLRYESDYYGFRGAGSRGGGGRGGYAGEYRGEARRRPRSRGPSRGYYARGTQPRRWGSR